MGREREIGGHKQMWNLLMVYMQVAAPRVSATGVVKLITTTN